MKHTIPTRSRLPYFGSLALAALLIPAGFEATAAEMPPKVPAAPQRLASDREIAIAVERHLTSDAATPAHLIDVEVKDGIVALSGSVESLLVRERAGELAQAVRGVRSVSNTIMVNPVERPDDTIARDAKIALARDPATDLYEVGVQVAEGIAILTGKVGSHAERQLAERVVKGVSGIESVKNDVVVQPQVRRKEAEVAADIKGMLLRDPWVDAEAIEVTVKGDVVTLAGSVDSAIERTRAVHDAWVNGVKRVDSTALTVKPADAHRRAALPVSDEQIEQLIKTAWKQHPRLSSSQPRVESKNHEVTLTGSVDHLAAKKIAGEIARNTTGVTQVMNLIRVRPEKLMEDAALAQEVKSALLRDPYVSRFDMNVSARNSRVFLDGRVDSSFEKNHSEFVASRVPGVVEVKNNLDVVDLEVPRKTDRAVRQEIEHGLAWSPYLEGQGIDVSVKDGIATLTGTAASWEGKFTAGRIAEQAGAESVLNDVRVKEQSS